MALFIPVVGDPKEVKPQKGNAFTLEELQTIIGGNIESLLIYEGSGNGSYSEWLEYGSSLIFDEEGKLKGLPVNHRATDLIERVLQARGGDVIVGPALICDVVEFI